MPRGYWSLILKHFLLFSVWPVGLVASLVLAILPGCETATPPVAGALDDRPAALGQTGKSEIFGDDGRRELYQLSSDSPLRRAARSTVMLVNRNQLGPDADTAYLQLHGQTLRENNPELCSDVAFLDQKAPGFCSGFLVGPDLVVTASHCIDSHEKCAATAFVFDYGLDTPSARLDRVPKSAVVYCAQVVHSEIIGSSTSENRRSRGCLRTLYRHHEQL